MESGKRRRIQLILSFIFTCFCFIGCSYQLIDVCLMFFSYPVFTKIKVEFPAELNAPSVSYCHRYVDVINLTEFNLKYNMSMKYPLGLKSIYRIQEVATKSDIFDMSPTVNQSLSSCLLRLPQSYSIVNFTDEACYKIFTVHKYTVQEYVCYMFDPSFNSSYSFNHLVYSLVYPSTFYYLKFPEFFQRTAYMKAIIHSNGSFPFTSAGLSGGFGRKARFKNASDLSLFRLTYSTYTIIKLPSPYVTGCRWYSRNACLKDCNKNSASKTYKKSPFSVIGTTRDDVTFITQEEIMNENYMRNLNKLEARCLKTCREPSCKTDYSVTYLTGHEAPDLTFVVEAPFYPFVRINFEAKMSFNDFLILTLSLFGFWLGLSLSHLHPKRWNYFDCRKVDKITQMISKKIKRFRKEKTRQKIQKNRLTFANRNRLQKQKIPESCFKTRKELSEWSEEQLMLYLSNIITSYRL